MKTRCRRLELAGICFAFGIAILVSPKAVAGSNPAARGGDGPTAADSRITIDVVVEDKLGHPVGGLQAEDFKVLDNTQPGKILEFHALDGKGGKPDPVHVLIIVDMINTGFQTVAVEREQLGEFLNQDGGRLAHPTSLGILADGGIKIMPGSAMDGKLLLANFEKVQTSLRSVGRGAGFYGAAERLEMSLTQISQLATYEGKQPGRKLTLVISPGWPMLARAGEEADMKQRNWTFDSIVDLSNELREAHMALYSLDPYTLGRSDPYYYQTYLKPVTAARKAEYGNLSLQVLAEHSGGRALTQGRDILGDINTAFRDAGPYYELTLEEPTADHPNEYHELRVSTDKPDTKVLTSAGYYAHSQQVTPASGKISK
jgi:VWFA-related protein